MILMALTEEEQVRFEELSKLLITLQNEDKYDTDEYIVLEDERLILEEKLVPGIAAMMETLFGPIDHHDRLKFFQKEE